MSTLGIVLVVVSAFTHALWNLLSKSTGDAMSFLRRALVYSLLIYAPVFVATQFMAPMPPVVLLLVAGSGALAGVYYFALARAYSDGTVSVAYPIARSFPLMILTWAGLFLNERPGPLAIAGIVLVVAGCFVLPYQRFRVGPDGFCLASYRNRSALWALVAALCTSVYSVLDKMAATRLPAGGLWTSVAGRVGYVYIQNAVSLGVLVGLMAAFRVPAQLVGRKRAVLCAVIFVLSYLLIMLALVRDPVAYVMAFRQSSIVIAAVASMLWLEKDFSWPRLVGVLGITAGVVLVGLS